MVYNEHRLDAQTAFAKEGTRDACTDYFFDFDYTLADSSAGVTDCIGYALRQLGFSSVSDEAACRTIGLSLPDMLTALVGPQPMETSAAFSQLFIQRADQVMADKTALLPGVREMVARFWERGLWLGIVSTKYRRRIKAILRREDLLAPFAVIVGGEDVAVHKPDPESLRLAMERLAVTPAEALYVGDSVTDALASVRPDHCYCCEHLRDGI